ncbi:MAG: DHHA1 domain-containing protein [Candidatus Aureabacteria bacterium]|nr:DHHA1 domain-containing protein [Candidatus Auribacterota bacterium]
MKVPSSIISALRSRRSFLISAHIRPDGDAIGSQLALRLILQRLGKRVAIQNHSPVPVNFHFLPGARLIRPFGKLPFPPEAAIVLDSPSPHRLGRVREHLAGIPLIVNVDHHVSNELFGGINWVDPKSSSVGEMISAFPRALGLELSRPVALCLYVALLTDMGKFQFMVTPESGERIFRLAADLIATGLVPYEIYKLVYNLYSTDQLKLLGEALHTLRFAAGGQIASMTVTRKMVGKYGVGDDNTDGLIAQPRDLRSTRVAVLFTECAGKVKVSFRSKEPTRLNMNRVASRFGGGGHPAAAGAEMEGSLPRVRRMVLKAVAEEIKRSQRK